jgi:hypothetical protein
MSNEKEDASDTNGYYEEPLQEDLCYPSFGSGLLVQKEVYSPNHQSENQEYQAEQFRDPFLSSRLPYVVVYRHLLGKSLAWQRAEAPSRVANPTLGNSGPPTLRGQAPVLMHKDEPCWIRVSEKTSSETV